MYFSLCIELPSQLFDAGERRIIMRDQHLHAGGDQPVLDRMQSLGRLRVMGAHAVALAIRVADEGEIHDASLP